jgi:hypothetical protein
LVDFATFGSLRVERDAADRNGWLLKPASSTVFASLRTGIQRGEVFFYVSNCWSLTARTCAESPRGAQRGAGKLAARLRAAGDQHACALDLVGAA